MQCLARKCDIRLAPCAVARIVSPVSNQRHARMGCLDPNLMLATGLEPKAQSSDDLFRPWQVVLASDFIMGDCFYGIIPARRFFAASFTTSAFEPDDILPHLIPS